MRQTGLGADHVLAVCRSVAEIEPVAYVISVVSESLSDAAPCCSRVDAADQDICPDMAERIGRASLDRFPLKAMRQVQALRHDVRLGAADVAAIKRLTTKVCFGDHVIVNDGDFKKAWTDFPEGQVKRGKTHRHLRAVSAAADKGDLYSAIRQAVREEMSGH